MVIRADVKMNFEVEATLLSKEEYEYYKENILHFARFEKNWWWLRTPGYKEGYVCFVNREGSVEDDGFVANPAISLRPALKIIMGPYNLGMSFQFAGLDWVCIGGGYALCTTELCKYHFNININKDGEQNNYDDSDIKSFLEKWLDVAPYLY